MPENAKLTTDNLTTAAGGVGGIAILSSVNYQEALSGNSGEIAKVIFGVALIVLGYFSNKPKVS